MMVDFKWIQIYLFLVTLLQFTATLEQDSPQKNSEKFSFIRVGHDATLSCENVINDQNNCDGTTWIFTDSRIKTVTLFELSQIVKPVKSKSDRLSVTENCSLVIKNVTVQDVGRYYCQQYKSGHHQGSDSEVHLSVVTMTEQKNKDEVTLNCSVTTFEPCELIVKWLLQGQDLDKQNKEVRTSQSLCSANVTFKTSHPIYTPKFESLKCEVTDGNKVKFTFSFQSSGEKPGEETTTAKTEPTTKVTPTEPSTPESTTTTESTNKTALGDTSILEGRWWLIAACLGLVVLIIITVAVIRWKRNKRNQRQADNNMADPEDGVSYATISFTKKPNRKARVRGKDDDDDEAVTYSTVKPSSSSSAGASADPSDLYTTINNPNN